MERCKFNQWVECEKADCEKCGWNPDVEKERKEELKPKRKRNRSWIIRYRRVDLDED